MITMEFKQNIIRVYQLFRHTIINFLFKKKTKFDDDLAENLSKRGYYHFEVGDTNFDNLTEILKTKIKKYFPEKLGDTRLYGIDDESAEVKNYFHKIINQQKKRIKSVSTIKNLYLHCTMGGFLQNINKTSSGGGWHRDHHFELFKIMIYLSDVSEDNGPFSYLEGSHTKLSQLLCLLIFKLFSKKTTRYSQTLIKYVKIIFRYRQKTFTGKKGTCIVFNSSGLHRGLEIKSGERLALTAYIYPYTTNNKTLYERSKHMEIPDVLQKKNIKDYVLL